MKTLIGLALVGWMAPAWGDATIDKCTTPAGKTYYSNTGCNQTDRSERQQIKEAPAVDSRELRAWAKRSPPQREPTRPIVMQQLQPRGPKDPFACENAKRMYNFERGYKYGKNILGRYAEMTEACKSQ